MFHFRRRFFTNVLCQHLKCQYRSFNSHNATIFALSTNIKNTGSPIAVVRVAGPQTMTVINQLTRNERVEFYKANPRKAVLQNLYDNTNGDLIDKGMLLWFPGPKSYTGEDMCEFHLHGSSAIITKLLRVLAQFEGCRPAQPGEFTKRALTNGKLQLIEAEGIHDLIQARTDSQRKRALSVLSGTLESKFNQWRESIIRHMAHLEAYIDFAEDELIEDGVIRDLKQNIQSLASCVEVYLNQIKQKSDLIKDGLRIAIVGEANVGKSSLINKLCEKDLSIISPISGTTRDVVETSIDFAGYSVCIADTAGIKDLQEHDIDPIEREGIKRAIQRVKECHILILVIDSLTFLNCSSPVPHYIRELIHDRNDQDLLIVLNKIDLVDSKEMHSIIDGSRTILKNIQEVNCLSCLSEEGFEQFTDRLKRRIETFCGDPQSEILFSNDRHVAHLQTSVLELRKALHFIDIDLAIAASHLRQASYELGCLTGRITTEDVLDVIFKDFCIGK